MKQIYFVLILVTVVFLPSSFAVHIETPVKKAEATVTFKKATFTVEEFKALTPKTFKEKTGKRLSFKDKMLLKFLKKKTNKEGRLEINWGAFALGFFLGLLGLIGSFFFKDKQAWKSALIGIGALIVLALLIGVVA